MSQETFQITLQTPLGMQRGRIVLQEKETGGLEGYLLFQGSRSPFAKGWRKGDEFAMEGVLRMPLLSIPYSARGKVEGDALTAVATTGYGTFSLKGSRLPQ